MESAASSEEEDTFDERRLKVSKLMQTSDSIAVLSFMAFGSVNFLVTFT